MKLVSEDIGFWHLLKSLLIWYSSAAMQFVLVAEDYRDEDALSRRLEARPAHIALGDKLVAEKKLLYGVAILNEKEQMTGSVLVCDFPSRKELDEWLKNEPYVVVKVWVKILIEACRVVPSFSDLVKVGEP